MVYDADRIQQRQQYYHAFAKSNSNSSIPTTIGKESTTSQSKYMKNKLSKSRLEIVNQSCSNDYTGAVPPRPSPRQYSSRVSAETKQDRKNKAGLPTRSLLDDSSSVASRRSRGSGKHEFTFAQEQKSTHSINSDREDSSHHTSETPVKKSGRGEDASEATTQYDNTTLGHQTQRQQQQGYGPESTVGDLSTIKSGTSLASSASSDLCLPLPYSKLPIAKPMFGREDELESLQQYLSEGASVTSLIGVGGVGKSHLAIHASRKWFAQQPFSRFVVWLNAATELTLRASYLEALQQVLMGNIQPEDASQHGEVIIVAELLQRQLRRQRRKEQVRLKRQEQRKKLREAESRNECTQVLSEDTNDPLDRDDTEDVEEEEQEEEIPMDTKALGQLLWDSLLQGVPQEYEWLVVVQNIPGGMGGIKGPAGFKEFFFPIPDTPKEEWNQGRVVLMTRHESYSGKTAMGDINSLLIGRLDEASSVRMMIANAVFNGENEIGQENLASPYKDRILKDAERVADKLVGPHYLDGNPLMMSTAIGHIVTNKMSLREYYNNLKHQVAQALETSGYGNGKVQSSVKRETAMSVCLEQAMDNAHANGLADILSSACFICAEGIPLKLLGDNAQRVQKLCSMNLLNLTGKDMYTMHRVHQRTAVDAIITHVGSSADDGSEVETEEFLCTPDHAVLNLRSVLSSFKPEKASTWRNARSCIVHIEALRIHYDVLERKRYLSSNFNHGYYADIIDSYASIMQWAIKDRHTAIAMYKESLRLRRSLQRKAITDEMNHSTGRNSTKNISSALSQTLASLGGLVDDDTEAKMFYQEALDIYCQVFGNDAITIELMTLYIALADVETKLEDSKRAYGHYKKAIELYFLIYGHNQNIYADDQKLFLAETLQKIGDLTHRQMKNHAEAELYLEGAVSLLRHLYDEGSKSKKEEMATALEALGSICHAQGKMKEARQYYRNALKMKDTIYGDAKWSDISSKCDGLSRDGTGQSAMTGTDHGSCDSDSLASDQDSESGLTMGDSKKPLLAKPSQESGVELIPVDAESRAKALSEKDAKMARTLHRLGVMSWNLGSLQQAEDYFEKTLVLQQKAFGEKAKNEDIAITLFSLGGLCNDLHDDQKKACWYYRRALECYYASYGKEAQNESIAQLLHAMGQSLQAQKEYEEARSCLKKVSTA